MKVSKYRTLARERWIRAGAWREKGKLRSEGRRTPKRRGRASKENLSRRKHKRVSELKSSPKESGECWFYSKFGQT